MPVIAGAIVPHAPLLLPELESPEVAEAAATIRKAVGSLFFDGVDAIVVLTPHAPMAGVYREVRGDLGAFGVPGIEGHAKTHDGLASSLGGPVLDGRVDHGVLVPLLLGGWEMPMVAVGVDGDTRLSFDGEERVAVVASVNGSAGISARAPLTAVPGADAAQQSFAAALEEDIAAAAEFELPGSCGRDVLAVFAGLFAGRPAEVLAHEAPVGVGYLVAAIR